MRILFAADLSPDPNAGASGTEYQTIRALRALGHEVDEIWAPDLPHRIRHGNLHYLLELPRGFRSVIRARCSRRHYDVIHVNQPHACLAAGDHRRRGRPGVFVNRSHGLEVRRGEVLAPWRRRLAQPEWRFPRSVPGHVVRRLLARQSACVARRAHGTIVSCSADAEFLARRYAVPPERVAVIHQAAPPEFVTRPAPAFGADRLKRLLYVGQFTFFKAPMILASAVSRILSAFPQCRMTWVCSADHHAAARALLSPGAAPRCEFLDWTDQASLMATYDSHGIFLFPSFFEGFGKAFLEAMTRGLCVVGSDAGGMRDLISDGKDGLLVAPGDVDGLVAAVSRLVGDPGDAARMSREARAGGASHTWDRVARETASFYEALLVLCGPGAGGER